MLIPALAAGARRRLAVSATTRTFFSFPDLTTVFSSHTPESDTQSFHERKILPYSQQQMYDVVANVDLYHTFLPFCTSSRVLRRASPKTSLEPEQLEAELNVGFMGLSESYVSKVTCRPFESVRATASSSTPLFDTLITTWSFQPASSTSPHPTSTATLLPHAESTTPATDDSNAPTLVSFDLVYAFAHPLHAQVSSAFFGQVSKMMIRAFEERCLRLYGPGRR
ncbi:dehydrase and lipid transport-domain-containing protein [Auriculariales sp. MPI-PUGE-AT-0066]|nr:dehydrase and lipid transport-domain-containing protein [Auriculariales sp. MPI-PUGE-AT-0066]